MTSLEQMIAKEKKIRRELDDFVLFNEDQGFSDLDFMADYKQELQEHYQKFRKIHDELVAEQGDKLHSDTYPDFDKFVEELRDSIKQVATEMRRIREEDRKRISREYEEMRLEREERKRRDEREDRIREEERQKEASRLEIAEKEREERLQKQEEEAKARLAKDEEERRATQEREKDLADIKAQLEKELKEKEILAANSLISEIKLIQKSLKDLYQRDLSELSDEEILEVKKTISSIDQRRFKLIEKCTRLSSIIPNDFADRKNVIDHHSGIPQSISDSHDEYVQRVAKECSSRNVSDANLRDSCSLNIELKKFSGYNSALDIYSFKSEFEKLYSKRIRSVILPEFLKNNFLEGTALSLVKTIPEIEKIWARLKEAYGDTRVLLSSKLNEVKKFGEIWNIRSKEKKIAALSSLIFIMIELKELAEKHSIENNLYYGGAISSIYSIIGFKDRDKFIEEYVESSLSEKDRWEKLIDFLKLKLKICEELLAIEKPADSNQRSEDKKGDSSDKPNKPKSGGTYSNKTADSKPCILCGELGHQATTDYRGRSIVQYFSCKKFAEASPDERFKLLRDKALCFQCIAPGAPVDTKKHKTNCFSKFCCKHPSHSQHAKKKHVLVCEEHKDSEQNKKLLEEYKNRCILGLKEKDQLPEYARNICCHNQYAVFHAVTDPAEVHVVQDGVNHFDQPDIADRGIYILQTIEIESKPFELFFDDGCGDLTVTKEAVDALEKLGRARLIMPGPIELVGVCDQKSTSDHGIYEISLPMHDGKNAVMRGLCVDVVTAEFPKYELQGDIERDIAEEFKLSSDHVSKILPKLPKEVGGKTAIMIGAKYLRYSPKVVFETRTGLRILESVFSSPDGSRGTIGGPHPKITAVDREWSRSHVNFKTFQRYHVAADLSLLGIQDSLSAKFEVYQSSRRDCVEATAVFEAIEEAGTVCNYRCPDCRNCPNCKKGKFITDSTIVEDVEQDLIEKSVEVDLVNNRCIAVLPFTADPKIRLSPSNEDSVKKIYKNVVRVLNRNPANKDDAIRAEKKLHDAGIVQYLDELPVEQQTKILEAPVKYYFVWRPVWNDNSISTDCRITFDGTFSSKGDTSLNSILAKGRNGMNSLVQIAIRWCVRRFGFQTDISKMYPSIYLKEDFWCYQLYMWDEELDETREPRIKVIKRLIYGVRPSGNQAEYAVREVARLSSEDYPRVSEVIHEDTYVDDGTSGEDSLEEALSTARDCDTVLKKGGFKLKGVTVTGSDPPSSLANADGVSVNTLGRKWYSKEDKISLKCSNLNFGKKYRGRRPPDQENVIPDTFTRAQCMGKVAGIHDLLGLSAPVVGNFKVDLRQIKGIDYESPIPEELRSLWKSNFEMIRDLGNLKWNRAIVPEDAVSLDIDTIDTADASKVLACSAIYARFKRKTGDYSCQLIFARTKIIPEGMTQPRAELYAAVMNASGGHVVSQALGDLHKECIKLTDSQVALHWICNDNRVYKEWVKNRVIEVNRLADKSLWRYVRTEDMIADIGTRKGVTLRDIDSESTWMNGFEWMKLDKSEFPVQSVQELKLDSVGVTELKKEFLKGDGSDLVWQDILESQVHSVNYHSKTISKHLSERYKFSEYILDPNKFRFRKVVRVLALVMKFCKIFRQKFGKTSQDAGKVHACSQNHLNRLPWSFKGESYLVTEGRSYKVSKNVSIQCKPGLVVSISDADVNRALDYYFRKSTLEVKNFVRKSLYEKISVEKNGILYYKGRILPSQKIGGRKRLSDVMIDLSDSTFFVPLIDRHSPLAYSIVNEVHWFEESASHLGCETVMRYVQKYAHVIDGKELISKFKLACHRCRVLEKRALEVAMGPIKDCNLSIAPAFFSAQVDLCGPLSSYSNHYKRATVKIWFAVFCCCTTSAVSIKVMDDYSTSAFLLAFLRFACRHGYPKFLLPDEGSQLVKGCKDMKLSFSDLQSQLSIDHGVQFETCPVGGHNMHGKVERKIRSVRDSIQKKLQGHRLSILQWESLGDQIANEINNLPIATVKDSSSLEDLDILTPNRLLLGRNNERSPSGPLLVCNDSSKIIQANADIFTAWFETWLISYVPKLMYQPKWFHSDRDMKVGDVVLFLKSEGELSRQYQFGMVDAVELGRDERIRTVSVRYRNCNSKEDRFTRRAVRDLCVVHHVDEVSIFEEVYEASRSAFCSYSS